MAKNEYAKCKAITFEKKEEEKNNNNHKYKEKQKTSVKQNEIRF